MANSVVKRDEELSWFSLVTTITLRDGQELSATVFTWSTCLAAIALPLFILTPVFIVGGFAFGALFMAWEGRPQLKSGFDWAGVGALLPLILMDRLRGSLLWIDSRRVVVALVAASEGT